MRYRIVLVIGILTLLVLGVLPGPLRAQAPSLKEQLEAQYAPGTVLVVQKEGILGVAPASGKTCAAKFLNGNLKPPDASCTAPLKNSSRMLTVGEKVNPSEIQVNVAQEKISFGLVECDSCNKGATSSSYKALVEFQFAKGYLEKGNVPEIEDTIGQLLSIDQSEDQQTQQPTQNPSGVLTNADVVKMVKAKIGDGVIISTIKTEPCCNFDVSVNGMIKLKEAGVSDGVIQAMRDAQASANAASDQGAPPGEQGAAPPTEAQAVQPTPAPSVPGQLRFSVRHRHSLWQTSDSLVHYCSGTLSVFPDGTVAYDCEQTDDPSGRCDHVSFAPGSLKQAKIGFAGVLHIESKDQGKFDFFGKSEDLKQALEKIAPQVQK